MYTSRNSPIPTAAPSAEVELDPGPAMEELGPGWRSPAMGSLTPPAMEEPASMTARVGWGGSRPWRSSAPVRPWGSSTLPAMGELNPAGHGAHLHDRSHWLGRSSTMEELSPGPAMGELDPACHGGAHLRDRSRRMGRSSAPARPWGSSAPARPLGSSTPPAMGELDSTGHGGARLRDRSLDPGHGCAHLQFCPIRRVQALYWG